MPRFSWDYEDCSEADLWFLMAKAYVDCAVELLSRMVDKEIDSSFHHAKVAVAQGEHAFELFLKGGIAQAGQRVPATHRLNYLYQRFCSLYTDAEFRCDVESLAKPREDVPFGQFARYPMDSSGGPWQGHKHIDIAIWYRQLWLLQGDFDRQEPELRQRYTAKTGTQAS